MKITTTIDRAFFFFFLTCQLVGVAPNFVGVCLGGRGVEESQAVLLAVARDAGQESGGAIDGGFDGAHVGRRRSIYVHPPRGHRGMFVMLHWSCVAFYHSLIWRPIHVHLA